MKCRSLFILTRLGLLGNAGLAVCSGGKPVGEGSTPVLKLETLRVHVPTTLVLMAPMASFGTLSKPDGLVGRTDVQNWAGIDVMKSMVMGGETNLMATLSYATANLFSGGLPVRLVAMTVWGMFYILDPEGSPAQGIKGLKSKEMDVPLPNNMPDLVFRYLMTQSGIPLEGGTEGTEAMSYDQAPEPVKTLASGQVEYVMLSEYVATITQDQAKQSGKNLDRTANLQEVWARVTGGQTRSLMTGMVMPQKPADSNQALIADALNKPEEAVAKVNALDERAVTMIAAKIEVPEAVVGNVIPRLQLEMVPAQKVKAELEDFYTRLTILSPDIVGGKMPAGGFYLADPR